MKNIIRILLVVLCIAGLATFAFAKEGEYSFPNATAGPDPETQVNVPQECVTQATAYGSRTIRIHVNAIGWRTAGEETCSFSVTLKEAYATKDSPAPEGVSFQKTVSLNPAKAKYVDLEVNIPGTYMVKYEGSGASFEGGVYVYVTENGMYNVYMGADYRQSGFHVNSVVQGGGYAVAPDVTADLWLSYPQKAPDEEIRLTVDSSTGVMRTKSGSAEIDFDLDNKEAECAYRFVPAASPKGYNLTMITISVMDADGNPGRIYDSLVGMWSNNGHVTVSLENGDLRGDLENAFFMFNTNLYPNVTVNLYYKCSAAPVTVRVVTSDKSCIPNATISIEDVSNGGAGSDHIDSEVDKYGFCVIESDNLYSGKFIRASIKFPQNSIYEVRPVVMNGKEYYRTSVEIPIINGGTMHNFATRVIRPTMEYVSEAGSKGLKDTNATVTITAAGYFQNSNSVTATNGTSVVKFPGRMDGYNISLGFTFSTESNRYGHIIRVCAKTATGASAKIDGNVQQIVNGKAEDLDFPVEWAADGTLQIHVNQANPVLTGLHFNGLDGGGTLVISTVPVMKEDSSKPCNHSYNTINAKDATCTTAGYTGDEVCSECGNVVQGSVIPALGHSWGVWIVENSSKNETITKVRSCDRCGKRESVTIPGDCPSANFTDVGPNAWYHEAVDYTVSNGLMNGTSKTTFAPLDFMTRSMLVTVLWRYDGSRAGYSNTFTDVSINSWYANAVSWASANGIVSGTGNGKFSPNDKVTREQTAAILYRYANYKGYDTSARTNISSYPDAADVHSYAMSAMSWAVAGNLITGVSHGSKNYLEPLGNANRAQVATILMRFINKYSR